MILDDHSQNVENHPRPRGISCNIHLVGFILARCGRVCTCMYISLVCVCFILLLLSGCIREIEPESQLPVERTLAEEARDVAKLLLQKYYLLHVPSPHPNSSRQKKQTW